MIKQDIINDVVIETIPVEIGNSKHIENCYLVYDEKNMVGILVDPGDKAEYIIDEIEKNKVKIKTIILTHTHADHFGALEKLLKYFNVNVYINENDVDGLIDNEKSCFDYIDVEHQNIDKKLVMPVKDSDIIEFGRLNIEFIHTPGHTNGGMCVYEKTSNVLFTGDTIFARYYGRTDLKSGSIIDMKNSIKKLFDRFSNVLIFPGHEESSNIDKAKKRINLLLAVKEGEDIK